MSLVAAEALLDRTSAWRRWHVALECANANSSADADDIDLSFVVDASEVVEYLFPSWISREGSGHAPTRLDNAVALLFTDDIAATLLPPHANELRHLQSLWHERTRLALVKLALLTEDLRASQNRIESVLGERGPGAADAVLEAIAREGVRAFEWKGITSGRQGIPPEVSSRLRLFTPVSVGLPQQWNYTPDTNAVNEYFESFQRWSSRRESDAPTNLADAIALDLLAQLNSALPANRSVILFTHSEKYFATFDDSIAIATRFTKNGARLVQPMETRLAQHLLDLQGRDWLLQEAERLGALMEMRERLREAYQSSESTPALVALIQACQAEAERLGEASAEWQVLERYRIGEASEDHALKWFRQAIRNDDRDLLRRVLTTRLQELLDEMSGLVGALGTAFVPVPGHQFQTVESGPREDSHLVKRVLISTGSGNGIHFLRLSDAEAEQVFARLDELIVDRRRKRKNPRVDKEIQTLLYECERRSAHEPRYCILLAAVFYSRALWFEAYDVATRGLRHLASIEGRGLAGNEAGHELRYAQAAAFHRWSLQAYGDLEIIGPRLERVAELYCTSAQIYDRSPGAEAEGGRKPDHRILRGLAALLGEVRELGLADLRLAYYPHETGVEWGRSLLTDFVALANKAYLASASEPEHARAFYTNTLLYSLAEADDTSTLGRRIALAKELETESNGDANFADTLAWHYYKLGRREGNRSRRRRLASRAEALIDSAAINVPESDRYYRHLVSSHLETIKYFAIHLVDRQE